MNKATTEIKRCGIVVIQSLSAEDKQTGKILHDNVLQYKKLQQKNYFCDFYDAKDKEKFANALNEVANNLVLGDIVTIHIETHGCEEGIYLSSKETVLWKEFYDLIRPINIKTGHLLFVVMAMCTSIAMISSIDPKDRAPYRAFICTTCDVCEREILNCFEAFYQEYFNMLDINKAIGALWREADTSIGKHHFKILSAEYVFNESLTCENNIRELAVCQLQRECQEIRESKIQDKCTEIRAFLKQLHKKYFDYYNFRDFYND